MYRVRVTEEICIIDIEDNLHRVHQIFSDNKHETIFVTDSKLQLLGIITIGDYRLRAERAKSVSELMNKDYKMIEVSAPDHNDNNYINEAASEIYSKTPTIKKVPVICGGKLLYIIASYSYSNWSRYSYKEMDCLIRASIADIFLSRNNSHKLIIDSYNALHDEESRYLFACLYLLHYIKLPGNDAVFLQQRMIEETLKRRLMEKGNDLREYVEYNRKFFFGEQYFGLITDDWKIIKNDEIYVDCGAFYGGTISEFIKYCNNCYKKIYAFEPIPKMCEIIMKKVNEIGGNRIELFQKGVWSSNAILVFSENSSSSKVDEKGETHIDVVSIDEIISEEEVVTFIKMDIEGSELEALKGAEKTIRRCKPKLAICIYHKPHDIIEIPSFILSLVPSYHLIIRHHSPTTQETVLYAQPPKEEA